MSQHNWTREQKLLLVTLIFVVLTCAAAYIIVPEVRRWVGLEGTDRDSNKNKDGETAASNSNVNPNASANRTAVNPPIQPTAKEQVGDSDRRKVDGIGFDESATALIGSNTIRVHVLDLALSNTGELYIKLRLCNLRKGANTLYRLFVWYTPRDEETLSWTIQDASKQHGDSINFKPGECRVVGAWSEEARKDFQLKRPLGVLHISQSPSSDEASINLNAHST
jgi:hypothetical protein